MKVTLCILLCTLGIAFSVDEYCLSKGDCALQCRYSSYSTHCLDNVCKCLSIDNTGVPCKHTHDCTDAYHEHSHCAPGDTEWHCGKDDMCHCVEDD